jgi:hypothetical protein
MNTAPEATAEEMPILPRRVYHEKDMFAVIIHEVVHIIHPSAAFNIAERIIESISTQDFYKHLDLNEHKKKMHRRCLVNLPGEKCPSCSKRVECWRWHWLWGKILEARLWHATRLRERNLRDIQVSLISKTGQEPSAWVSAEDGKVLAQAVSACLSFRNSSPEELCLFAKYSPNGNCSSYRGAITNNRHGIRFHF